MGLDNGFICRGLKKEDIPPYVKYEIYSNPQDIYMVYFRKCWGIRNEIVNLLHGDPRGGHTNVESEDLLPIAKILMKYLDKEYYEDNADSIWEYEEQRDNLRKSIITVIWLKTYMDQHPEVSCVFYDSY